MFATAIDRAVQGGFAIHVDVVDVTAARFERELHRRKRFLVRAWILSGCPDADASRHHQRRRPAVGRQ